MDFYIYIFFPFGIWYILIELNEIFPMKPSEFKISISTESYDEKNYWKLPKLLRCRKSHSFQTIKDINSKFWLNTLIHNTWIHKLNTWMKIVLKCHGRIFYTFWKISRQRASRSGAAGPGRAGSSFRKIQIVLKWS